MLEHLIHELNSRDEAIREAASEKARSLPPGQLLRLVRQLVLPCPPAQHALAKAAMQAEDPRYISAALILLQQARQDALVILRVNTALKRLLPRMCEEDAEALTDEQAEILLSLLFHPYFDVELTLCILDVLRKFGEEGAIPVVKALADYGRFVDASKYGLKRYAPHRRVASAEATPESLQRVKQAARECLNQLSLRAEEAKQAQTLLRPSDASTLAAPEVLLRPAAPTADTTAPEELLRPSGGTLPVQEPAPRSE
jgi:hypothetical protein